MEEIYSKSNPGVLLHVIFKKEDIEFGRKDLIGSVNFIQCSALNFNDGHTFKPHKHKYRRRDHNIIAQESWHVIQGSVRCHFYDLDNSFLGAYNLNAGDTSFTLQGGHTYVITEDNTKVLEYKTGPYEGQELDKEFI